MEGCASWPLTVALMLCTVDWSGLTTGITYCSGQLKSAPIPVAVTLVSSNEELLSTSSEKPSTCPTSAVFRAEATDKVTCSGRLVFSSHCAAVGAGLTKSRHRSKKAFKLKCRIVDPNSPMVPMISIPQAGALLNKYSTLVWLTERKSSSLLSWRNSGRIVTVL